MPSCYHHLCEVFSKAKAPSLPPHRSYDFAIDLIPESTLGIRSIDLIPESTIPKGCLYSVSGPEKKAMTEYIQTSLKAWLI